MVFDPFKDKIIPKPYLATHMVQNMSIGDNENRMCLSIDIKNNELPTLYIKNLQTGKFYYELVKYGSSGEFVNNDRHLLYVKKDPFSYRDCKIVLHEVGDNFLERDLTIFEEKDEQNWLNLEQSSCKKWLHLIQVSKDGYGHFLCKKSEFENLNLDKADKFNFVKIAEKSDEIREIKINEKGMVLQNNDDQIQFIDIDTLEETYQKLKSGNSQLGFNELFKPKTLFDPKSSLEFEGTVVTDFDFYHNKVILYSQKITEAKIFQIHLENNTIQELVFSENQLGTVHPYPNNNTKSKSIKFHFSSPQNAEILYQIFLPEEEVGEHEVRILSKLSQKNIPEFEAKIIEVPSRDYGVTIPVTLLTPTKKKYGLLGDIFNSLKNKTSQNFKSDKLLIKSYGCYGLSLYLEYSPSDLYLLSQGYSIAYAHIRGGSEKGSDWHQAARKELKMNSITDLEDVVKHFRVNSDFSDLKQFSKSGNLLNFPRGIFAESDSAGATLLMAMVNRNPSLLDGIILSAPFLNLKTLQDETQALTQSDWLEFGQWDNPIEAEVLEQICPLTHIENTLETKAYNSEDLSYPPIYIQAYSGDYRTPLWTIVDYVKKFRKLDEKIKMNQSQLVGRDKPKFEDIGIALNVKDGSHKGSSEDSYVEMSEKIAFMEWLSEDLAHKDDY